MLPKNLLVTIKKKNEISPKYLQDENQAEALIKIFKKLIGCKYKECRVNTRNI